MYIISFFAEMSLVLGEKFIAERLICGRIGKYLERPIIADTVVQPPCEHGVTQVVAHLSA